MLALADPARLRRRLIRVWSRAVQSPLSGQDPSGFAGFATTCALLRFCKILRGKTADARENDCLKLQIAQLQGRARKADRPGSVAEVRQAHAEVPMIGRSCDWRDAGYRQSDNSVGPWEEHDGIRKNMGVNPLRMAVSQGVEAYFECFLGASG